MPQRRWPVLKSEPKPFSEADPNLRVYGPGGEVDPVEALRKEKRHQKVRRFQKQKRSKEEIASLLGIEIEDVEESLDPKGPKIPMKKKKD